MGDPATACKLGVIPTPATAKSQATRLPSAVTTASSRLVPANAATSGSGQHPDPALAVKCADHPADLLAQALARGFLPGKMAVTSTPSSVREAATSQPMKPIPTTTADALQWLRA